MSAVRVVDAGGVRFGEPGSLCLIAGPCVIESEEISLRTAEKIREVTAKLGVPFVFKSSYRKDNRSSVENFEGPGVDEGLKAVHTIFTFGVFFPSMVTAFTVIAALENGARKKGGRGFIMWIRKLPWGNPSVTGQLLAALGFVLGGVSGLVNASNTVNLVVHNTSFIVGHFHLTVGTAVALSIMAISMSRCRL